MQDIGSGVYEQKSAVSAVPRVIASFLEQHPHLRVTAMVFIPTEMTKENSVLCMAVGFLTLVTEPRQQDH
jgi:hypothetical protein